MPTKTRTRKTTTTATTTATEPDRALRAVPEPEAAATRTSAEDTLWVALYDQPAATAAELALAAGIGKSTASKILAAWAKDGTVTRTSGSIEGGRRTADRWTITDNADTNVSPTGDGADTITDAHPVETVDDAPETTAVTDTPDSDEAGPQPADADDTAVESDVQPVTVDADSGAATQDGDKAPRLAPGGLRGLVEDFLRDHEGEEFSPSKIGKALGRSSGAVNNALEKLVETGYANKTNAAPKRFALTTSTGDTDTPTR
jgi:predicted transcriptional regulator